jgi:hypothetical protein
MFQFQIHYIAKRKHCQLKILTVKTNKKSRNWNGEENIFTRIIQNSSFYMIRKVLRIIQIYLEILCNKC